MSPRRVRGIALGPTLMLIMVAITVALTLAGVAFMQISADAHALNVQAARNAAESAISLAIDKLIQTDMGFGARVSDRVDYSGPNGAQGKVTFDPASFDPDHDLRLPHSTYNYDRNGVLVTKMGHGSRVVPRNSVHLVGTGFHGGVTASVEAVVSFPNYSFALAAAGSASLDASLVAGMKSGAELVVTEGSNLNLNAENLAAGDVVSNNATESALVLRNQTHVTGDAEAVGKVNVDGTARVDGDVRPSASVVTLPVFDIDKYDPSLTGFAQKLSDTIGTYELEGYGSADNLTINGDLTLSNALLFVRGNLHVRGGIRGSGAVFVKGSTLVTGSATLGGSSGVALVCGGDVTLQGSDRSRSFIEGIVWAAGSIDVSHITVVGSVIQASSSGRATISNSNLICSAARTNVPSFLPYDTLTGYAGQPLTRRAPRGDGTVEITNAAVENALYPRNGSGNPALTGDDYTDYCHNHLILRVAVRNRRIVLINLSIGRGDGGGGAPDGGSIPALESNGGRILLPDSPWASYPDGTTSVVPANIIRVWEFAGPEIDQDGNYDDAVLRQACDRVAASWGAHIEFCNGAFGGGFTPQQMADYTHDMALEGLRKANARIPPAFNYQYDPNQFLNNADRMRVVLWRNL